MKMISLMIAPIMALLFSSNVMAESYIVKKGDMLSPIAKKHGVTAEEIKAANPKITNIDKIQPGWELEIPARQTVANESSMKKRTARNGVVIKSSGEWTNPGANKYHGGLYEGLTVLGYSPESRVGLANEVLRDRKIFAVIGHISRGGLVVAEDGSKYQIVKMLGGGGKGQPIEILEGPNGVDPNWPNKNKGEAGKIYSFKEDFLLIPLICGNPALIKKVPVEPSFPVPVIITELLRVPPPEHLVSIVPPLEVNTERKAKILDRWDAYVGAGDYRSRIEGDDNHGKYWWMKYRNRPMWYALEENEIGVKNVGLGFVAFLSGGDGIAAKYYNYKHHLVALGGTAKVYTEKSDLDFDVMLGRQWSKGSWMGVDANEQVTDFLMLSAHANMYSDTEYFHKSEVNADLRIPLHTNVKKGEKNNDLTIEGTYTQWITKFGDTAFTVAPGFNAGVGYEAGAEHKGSVKVGPAVEFSSYDNVIGGLSVLNYKFQGSGQWHPFGGYVSLDGIDSAWKAAHITGLSEEELQNLEGSKLLSNPADFL